MDRSRKAAVLAGIAVAGTIAAAGPPGGTAHAAGHGRELRGAVTIAPGREGLVEVTGYAGAVLDAGSVLRLTAPDGTDVTEAQLAGHGFRGAVAVDGSSGTYTFTGGPAADAWRERTFPFVLAVADDAMPGTRLTGCALRLLDARGDLRDEGTCAVTVGLPAPTMGRPESGVPLSTTPETSGTAYPGARVTVRDAQENEVCAATATADGTWSCTPSATLPPGPGRLQATATLNGVSAMTEQIDIMVAGA